MFVFLQPFLFECLFNVVCVCIARIRSYLPIERNTCDGNVYALDEILVFEPNAKRNTNSRCDTRLKVWVWLQLF